jgi:DNA-binding CsgD family transcriptional regulator
LDNPGDLHNQPGTSVGALATLVDRLPLAVFVVDSKGVVELYNYRARLLLGEGDALRLSRADVLKAARADQSRALLRLIRGATEGNDQPPTGGAMTLRRPTDRAPLSVMVIPLEPDGEVVGADETKAAVLVSDPEQRLDTTEKMLGRLYGFTPTEASLAVKLMDGRGLGEACRALSINRNTAKTHLRRIFAKTGTSRQGELISLLLSGPALFRPHRKG